MLPPRERDYEEAFAKVPEGEDVSGSPGEGAALDFVERKISEIRKSVEPQLLGEEIAQKLNQIIDETEYFIKQGEVPGVAARWKQINPQLDYFDSAFYLAHDYYSSNLAARNKYLAKAKEKYERDHLEYLEERVFQDELLHTLTLLFEEFSPDFKNSESL